MADSLSWLRLFSEADLHRKTEVRINIFGLASAQNGKTDVRVNVMFVAEALLTFQSPTSTSQICSPWPITGIRLSQNCCTE